MDDFKITKMTPEILAEKFPDVFQAVKNQGFGIGVEKGTADGFKEGHTKGFCAGAESERQRIKAVEAQSLPGHEALIEQLKADGKTTGEQAAIAVLNAEKEKRKTRLQALQDGAIPPVPPSSTDAQQFIGGENKKNFEALTSEYAKENKCSKGKAMMACARLYPSEHQDFINRTNPK